MADVDALATLGDPWPNLGDVKNDVAFLGLADAWETRLEALCRAELEQAHGRMRVVHRRRPGRALHVGNVLPGGSGWQSGEVRVRRQQSGRPKTTGAMSLDELEQVVVRLGGMRATARALGCGQATVSRYLAGRREIPSAFAERVRVLVAEVRCEA
jgi:hypothetical protein